MNLIAFGQALPVGPGASGFTRTSSGDYFRSRGFASSCSESSARSEESDSDVVRMWHRWVLRLFEIEVSPRWCRYRSLLLAQRASQEVLVIDIGYGYTKYGFGPVPEGRPDYPHFLQLCSSLTHPAAASRSKQIPYLMSIVGSCTACCVHRWALRTAEKPATRSLEHPQLLILEPFNLATEAEVLHWRRDFLQPQIPRGSAALCVPQPLAALLAHTASPDGIVVNLGQREGVAVPILDRKLLRIAVMRRDSLGAAGLTQALLERLVDRRVGISHDMLTWCRDIKEKHCAVWPSRLAAEASIGEVIEGVEVTCEGRQIQLGRERYLVPEILFREGGQGLPGMILKAVECAVSTYPKELRPSLWGRLLSSVVVVGGSADFPGLRPRLEHELTALLSNPDFITPRGLPRPVGVKVLSPLSGVDGGRFAVLRGGQLAAFAACAAALGQSLEGLEARRPLPSSFTEASASDRSSERSSASGPRASRQVPLLGRLKSRVARSLAKAVQLANRLRHSFRS